MSLLPVVGHAELQERLRQAAGSARLPQSLLFRGPAGTGKQRLALWLAGLVLCENDSRPCGSCTSCRLADGLQHPDIHWFFPLPSPRRVAAHKRREKLEEARLDELQARRERPLWKAPEGSASIFLPMVEEIRARAVRRPAMGRAAVFVVGDAERMVPQASSPEAANAFLKLLEEPPSDTLLFLTSSRPGLLLPTIRSRVLEIRVTPPTPEQAAEFLVRHAGFEQEPARAAARRVEGSIGRALAGVDDEEGEPRAEAGTFLACAVTGSRADRLRLAASYPPAGARGPYSSMLEALGRTLRDAAAVAAGASEAVLDPAIVSGVRELASIPSSAFVAAVDHVEAARDAAAGNGNPQAISAVLLEDLSRCLRAS